MDCRKVGNLLSTLRKERGMTQKQVADALNISDKTVSKWERGLGCPDVSLLTELSEVFHVSTRKILQGDLEPNELEAGNMKRIKFYVCPECGNIMTGTGNGELFCCGRKLEPLVPEPLDEAHDFSVEEIENEYSVMFSHEMTKEHYLSFAAYICNDKMYFMKLYPEQNAHLRIPILYRGELYVYCTKHGLKAGRITK